MHDSRQLSWHFHFWIKSTLPKRWIDPITNSADDGELNWNRLTLMERISEWSAHLQWCMLHKHVIITTERFRLISTKFVCSLFCNTTFVIISVKIILKAHLGLLAIKWCTKSNSIDYLNILSSFLAII